MRYYIGPWKWIADGQMPRYSAPDVAVGCIDLGTIPQMSVGGADRGRLLCWTNDGDSLPSEYELLGVGDCRELNTDASILNKFQSLIGYRPQGDKLVDAVWDCLEGGADINGETGPLPLVPTVQGDLELHFAGHSVVKSRRFVWGNDRASPKLKQLLRKQFRELLKDAQDGKLKDDKHAFRVLDYWCDKYRVDDWREFVPEGLQKDVPGRVKHETMITDNFNRADADPLGSSSEGWSWTEVENDIDISSNKAVPGVSAWDTARSEYDLSSSDHYAQGDCVSNGDTRPGMAVRFNSSAKTYYLFRARNDTSVTHIMFSVVSGTITGLSQNNTTAFSSGSIKLNANGSSITGLVDGVSKIAVTNTAITGNLRTGIHFGAGTDTSIDNFLAADISVNPLLSQLERRTMRGIHRGIFTS